MRERERHVSCVVCGGVSAVTRMHACRYRRVQQQCGWRAADWQFKFSFLLSQVMPKVFDVAHHPTTQQTFYVHDAEQEKLSQSLIDFPFCTRRPIDGALTLCGSAVDPQKFGCNLSTTVGFKTWT